MNFELRLGRLYLHACIGLREKAVVDDSDAEVVELRSDTHISLQWWDEDLDDGVIGGIQS